MDNNLPKAGLEQTLLTLLDEQSKYGVDNINMLLMLSLVNLMGIVDILQRATGGEGLNLEISGHQSSATGKNRANSGAAPNDDLMYILQQAASGNLKPDQLMSMLSGKVDPAMLAMLSQMMPPPPPPRESKTAPPKPPPKPPGEQNVKEKPSAVKEMNVEEERCKKNSGAKNLLKWDPRLG